MKAGWEVKKLGEVCTVIAGQSPEGKFYNASADGLPFYQGKKQFGEKYIGKPTTWTTFVTKESEKDDVLMSVRAPVGPINFSTEKMCIGRGLAAIRASNLIDKDFLFNFLLKHEAEIVGNKGAVFDSITKSQIENILLPTPPIPEQQRIVAILDQAFEGIAKARANAEQNLQNARALFESHLQSVFTQRDEGWVRFENALSDLCELIVDCEHKTAPTQEIGIASIRTPNIGKGELLLDGVYRVSDETYKEWTRRAEPQSGDLILAREAPAGNLAVIPENTKLCLGQRTVLIRPNTEIFIAEFLCFYLLQPEMQSKLLAHSRGATVQHVNMKDIRALKIGSLPNLEMQKLIAINIKTTKEKSQRLETLYQRKIELLDELKKSLLQQAFAGEL